MTMNINRPRKCSAGNVLSVVLLIWVHTTNVHITPVSTADSSEAADFYSFPGLLDSAYTQLGDINIGANVLVTSPSKSFPSGACSGEITRQRYALEVTETIAFAVSLVNADPRIFPNVSLGFIIRGSCTSIGVTMASYLAFLPRNRDADDDDNNTTGSNSCSTLLCSSSAAHARNASLDSWWQGNDVIGTVAPGWSSLTVPVSSLHSAARLPIVGAVETNDELSDKGKHPYFFRVVPPDVYQVQAMLHLVRSNGWSYISVLYVDGAYGQNNFDNMQQRASAYGICIATSHRLLYNTDYDEVMADLLRNSRARAVVLFVIGSSFHKIVRAAAKRNATGHFVWIGGDGLVTYPGYLPEGETTDPALGAFIVEVYSHHIPAYYEYLRKQNLITSNNPWLKPIWEYYFHCSFDKGTCNNSAGIDSNVMESDIYKPLRSSSLRIDAVLTFAIAAHNLLAERCPDARGRDARACITGELLREYMKNATFDGYQGRVEFDENQEVKGKYFISQFKYEYQTVPDPDADSNSNVTTTVTTRRLRPKVIGIYDISNDTIRYFNDSVDWSHLNVLERIYPPRTNTNQDRDQDANSSLLSRIPDDDDIIPESVCSGPCVLGEYKIEKDVPCCWECRRCRDNERLVDGNTSCEACPAFTWPDPSSAFTTCLDIPLAYSTLEDTIPLTLTSITLAALLIYASVFVGYVAYRNERVIKASSRELSVIQLVAILGGYTNVLLFQTMPTDGTCSAIFFLFCTSFVLLYSPLLVKTVRIYRIFQSGKTNNRRLPFISPESQLVIAFGMIAVQVALCVANFVLFSPGALRTQPIWSVKYVELSCDLTLPGLASFLGFNIVLVSLCSVFAFKVRKLPDNFNESSFISMCVSTTLLIWLAFIPTYFTADREYIRSFLLSTALLLNHSVALIFLFVPKIYAAAFLPPESGTGTLANTKKT